MTCRTSGHFSINNLSCRITVPDSHTIESGYNKTLPEKRESFGEFNLFIVRKPSHSELTVR